MRIHVLLLEDVGCAFIRSTILKFSLSYLVDEASRAGAPMSVRLNFHCWNGHENRLPSCSADIGAWKSVSFFWEMDTKNAFNLMFKGARTSPFRYGVWMFFLATVFPIVALWIFQLLTSILYARPMKDPSCYNVRTSRIIPSEWFKS